MGRPYDYLIVGAGPFGSVFAYEARKRGKRCFLVEKRAHTGGNIYCSDQEGIRIHVYGAHIFHTSDQRIWDYVNQFATFNHFVNSPIANYNGECYNLPFNMNTFNKMWGTAMPQQARAIIEEQKSAIVGEPSNLEEQAIRMVGKDIYQKLVKGYTEKQWGRSCTSLPPFIIKRLPVRFTYDNNYFNDRYQGIPEGGYNRIIDALLDGCEVRLNVDFLKDRGELTALADKVVYTGMLDEYFDYAHGHLEYRSLRFEIERLDVDNYQGVAVMNFTDEKTPYTRIIEHKHFEFGKQAYTYITKEYPQEWNTGMEPYYPVNDEKNQKLVEVYKEMARSEKSVIFGGRLAEYRYYDMDKVFSSALEAVKCEFGE